MTVQVSDRAGKNLRDGVTRQPSARVRSMKKDAVRSRARIYPRASACNSSVTSWSMAWRKRWRWLWRTSCRAALPC